MNAAVHLTDNRPRPLPSPARTRAGRQRPLHRVRGRRHRPSGGRGHREQIQSGGTDVRLRRPLPPPHFHRAPVPLQTLPEDPRHPRRTRPRTGDGDGTADIPRGRPVRPPKGRRGGGGGRRAPPGRGAARWRTRS